MSQSTNKYGIPYADNASGALDSSIAILDTLSTFIGGQEDLTAFQRNYSSRDPLTGITIMLDSVQTALEAVGEDLRELYQSLKNAREQNKSLKADLNDAYGPIPGPQFIDEEKSGIWEIGRRFGYRQASGNDAEPFIPGNQSVDEIATATDIDTNVVQAVIDQIKGDGNSSNPQGVSSKKRVNTKS
nr:hypothetical protein [uncultured Cohaesibacter sp.]